MKAGDLVRYYRDEAWTSPNGDTVFFKAMYPAIVLEDYKKHTKLLKLYVTVPFDKGIGNTIVVHSSTCSVLKRGHKWNHSKTP
jgi:hypothetical protein